MMFKPIPTRDLIDQANSAKNFLEAMEAKVMADQAAPWRELTSPLGRLYFGLTKANMKVRLIVELASGEHKPVVGLKVEDRVAIVDFLKNRLLG